jgi:hypothetical protein
MMPIRSCRLCYCAVAFAATVTMAAAAHAQDTTPTQAAAAQYAEVLGNLADFRAEEPGDSEATKVAAIGDLAWNRLLALRNEVKNVDRSFRRAASDAAKAPADPSLVAAGGGRKLPRNRLAGLTGRLTDYQSRLRRMVQRLQVDCDALELKHFNETRDNAIAISRAVTRYKDFASGRARGVWVDKQTGRPVGRSSRAEASAVTAAEFQKAMAKQWHEQLAYKTQRQHLEREINSLEQLQKFSNRLIAPVIASQTKLARQPNR